MHLLKKPKSVEIAVDNTTISFAWPLSSDLNNVNLSKSKRSQYVLCRVAGNEMSFNTK